MAPIDHEYLNDNTGPLALLGGYIAITSGLLGLITHRVLYRSFKALPPSQNTRQRKPHRKNHTSTFAVLTALSLGLAGYYLSSILTVSYQVWAYERGQFVPQSILGGDGVFNEDGSIALQLGRWLNDSDIIREVWEIAMSNSRRQWWTQQLFLGRSAFSLYVAIDGHRRNLPHLWAFILTSGLVSLSFAQNLYFLAVLLTPVPLSEAEKHNELVHKSSSRRGSTSRKASRTVQNAAASTEHAATIVPHWVRTELDSWFPPKPADWAPHTLVYSIPIVAYIIIGTITSLATNTASFNGFLTQSFVALFAPAIIFRLVPLSFGRSKSSPARIGRRALGAYRLLSLFSIVLHFSRTVVAILDNDTSRHRHYYFFRDRKTVLQHTTSSFGRVLGAFAEHPACGYVVWDVLFSGLSLIIWAGIRGINCGDILRSAALANSKEIELVNKAKDYVQKEVSHLVNHVSDAETPESSPLASKARSRKSTTAKKKKDQDVELEVNGETGEMAKAYEGTSTRSLNEEQDKKEDWEAGALAWAMLALGGLGVAASGVLGGELV